jgi:transcriptional regulator with XRE-family HTH domain
MSQVGALGTMSAALSSWKEIAAYLGKGVRTVQRWEQQFSLPVRRPNEKSHIIFAIPAEIDAWLKSHRQAPAYHPAPLAVTKNHRMRQHELLSRLKTSYSRLEKNEQVLGKQMSRLIATFQDTSARASRLKRLGAPKPAGDGKPQSKSSAA